MALCTTLLVTVAASDVAAHDGDLPDLVADPVSDPLFQIDADERGVDRLLLRFNSWVHNDGAGPLEIRRTPTGFSQQVFRDAGPGLVEVATAGLRPQDLKFEDTDGHDHWHLQKIVQYSLVSSDGAFTVAPSMKAGFCLLDTEQVTGDVDPRYGSLCGEGEPNPEADVTMGVSSGWRDLYDQSLPFQWVDVSEVLPGTYTLRSVADPDDVVVESDEDNNLIPGDLPNQLVPGFNAEAQAAAPGTVTLGADAIGGVTGPRFKVVDGPDHGTLDVPTGTWVTAPDVEYTGAGADRFVHVAADPGSAYPTYPGRATVLVGGTGERVALSGVPEQMAAGVTVDLDALLVGAAGAVTWSTSAGAIDAAGRLTAPQTGGTITVTATGPGGATDTMAIRVVAPPREPAPAPTVPDDPAGRAVVPTTSPTALPLPAPPRTRAVAKPKRTPIGSVRVRRIGRQYAVSVVPRSSGRLRATLLKGKRRLASCSVRVVAKKPAMCRLKVRRGATAIALTLVRRTGGTERRRVAAPR